MHLNVVPDMKSIGFLSFGHWSESRHSQTRSAGDVLHQSIDLAVAAEELGVDGAYYRVHHFARQLASPFPLLAAVGAASTTELTREQHTALLRRLGALPDRPRQRGRGAA